LFRRRKIKTKKNGKGRVFQSHGQSLFLIPLAPLLLVLRLLLVMVIMVLLTTMVVTMVTVILGRWGGLAIYRV